MRDGPELSTLTRRLLDTPGDFLLDPRLTRGGKAQGVLHIDALVNDTLRWLDGGPLSSADADLVRIAERGAEAPTLRLIALCCWLLHDTWFKGQRQLAPGALTLLTTGLRALATAVRPADCVQDDERREELARLVLRGVGLRPAGESAEAAQDRLASIDSVARLKVAKQAAEAAKRAQQVREAAAKAAAEAASYYGRE